GSGISEGDLPEICDVTKSHAKTQRGGAVTPVAQTSKSAVSRVSKPADGTTAGVQPTWKSAIQQVWKPALQRPAVVALKILAVDDDSAEWQLQSRKCRGAATEISPGQRPRLA